jgi:hypothetical protein
MYVLSTYNITVRQRSETERKASHEVSMALKSPLQSDGSLMGLYFKRKDHFQGIVVVSPGTRDRSIIHSDIGFQSRK